MYRASQYNKEQRYSVDELNQVLLQDLRDAYKHRPYGTFNPQDMDPKGLTPAKINSQFSTEIPFIQKTSSNVKHRIKE
jgi:hypothetical protein